jgi:hypothetical protein
LIDLICMARPKTAGYTSKQKGWPFAELPIRFSLVRINRSALVTALNVKVGRFNQ